MARLPKLLPVFACTLAVITMAVKCQDEGQTSNGQRWVSPVQKGWTDSQGRWWIYDEGKTAAGHSLPFVPHGYMPAESAVADDIKLDLESTTRPQDGKYCVKLQLRFKASPWAGVAWISHDKCPHYERWWGEDSCGTVYDLSGAKELVFHLASPDAAAVKVKLGILGDKPFGDSTKFPVESDLLHLTPQWKQFRLPLEGKDLRRIANGLTIVVARDEQPGEVRKAEEVTVYLDSIYIQF